MRGTVSEPDVLGLFAAGALRLMLLVRTKRLVLGLGSEAIRENGRVP